MGQKERSATLERIDEYYRTHGTARPARPRDPNDAIASTRRATTYLGAQERRRLHGRHPRPPQGGRPLQRRHRLRHLRSHSPTATRPTSGRYGQDAIAAATRANVSFYGVDPRGSERRSTTRPRSDRFPPTRRSTSAWGRCRTSCRSRRTACACCRTRPAASPRSTPTISRRASPAHHPGQQQLLRARLLLGRQQARRTVSEPDRPGQAARAAGARAQGLRRAQGPAARRNRHAAWNCRVSRDARSPRQPRARHRTRRSAPSQRR